MVGGIIHLIKNYFGPSERALRGVTTTLLLLLSSCRSETYGCEESILSDGSLSNVFAGGARSGGSPSRSSVPSLLSNSPISRRSEWSVILEEGEGERAMLLPFLIINEAQIEEGSTVRNHTVEPGLELSTCAWPSQTPDLDLGVTVMSGPLTPISS